MLLLSKLKNRFVNSILVRGASSAFILRLASMSLGLVSSVLLGRILGAAEYGIYAYVLSVLNLLAIPATLGLPELVVRNVAVYQAKDQWSLLRGLVIRTNQLVIFSSLLIFAISVLVLKFHEFSNPTFQSDVLLLGLLILPFLGLSSLRNACLRGLRLIFLSQLSESLVQPSLFLAIFMGLCVYQGFNIDAVETMQIRIVSIVLTFFLGTYLLMHNLPKGIKSIKADYETLKWSKSALSFMFIGGIMFINNQVDILMLGVFKNSSDVGIYKVVTIGASLVTFGLSVVNIALGPNVAKLYAEKDIEALQKLLTFSARISILTTLPVALVFVFSGNILLEKVYDVEYSIGANALNILTIAQVVNAIFGSVALLLSMTGNEKYVVKGQIFSAVVNVLLNYFLIPEFGMEGAAIATSVSLVIWNILLFTFAYKKLQLNTTALYWT